MQNWKAKDVIAVTVILGYLLFAYATNMTMVPSAVMLVIGYYFARREEPDHKDPPKQTE